MSPNLRHARAKLLAAALAYHEAGTPEGSGDRLRTGAMLRLASDEYGRAKLAENCTEATT